MIHAMAAVRMPSSWPIVGATTTTEVTSNWVRKDARPSVQAIRRQRAVQAGSGLCVMASVWAATA